MNRDFRGSAPLDEDDDVTALQDGHKLMIDASKHLTTLSTGVIVILATFLKDILANQKLAHTWMIDLTLVSLGVSLLFSVLVMWFVPLRLLYSRNWALTKPNVHFHGAQRVEFEVTKVRHWCYRLALVMFIVGLGSFAFFVIRNL